LVSSVLLKRLQAIFNQIYQSLIFSSQ